MRTTAQETRRREAAVRGQHRASGHPFLIWLGTETLAAWIARHPTVGVRRAAVQAWINGRNGAPPWFVDLVAVESAGAVDASCWQPRLRTPLRGLRSAVSTTGSDSAP